MSYLALFITLMLAAAVCAAPATLIRNIEPLSVRGVNYFPRDTPWDKMWTETPTEVWEKDMAAAAKLGVNTVRKTINMQRMNQTERPLLIGEFGMCTSRDPQHGTSAELISKLNDAPGTEADQAQVYRVVLDAVKQERIGGAMAWCLYDYPIKNPNESQFGLLRLDGSEKPAANILRDAFQEWSQMASTTR